MGSLSSGFFEEQSLAEFCHPFYQLIVFFWVGSIPDGLLALLSVVIQCTAELDSNWKTG